MTSDHAAIIIQAHGIDAWATDDPDVVLAMATWTRCLPGGVMSISEPVLLDATDRTSIMEWLGY